MIDIAGFLATFGFYPQIYLKSWPGMEGAAGRRERMAAAAARARETGPAPAISGVTGRLFPNTNNDRPYSTRPE
jgi:hypothetical protein